MRKSKEETAQTRERIVATAAAEFRRNGIGATGIADLMAAAGLTNGGFYRHFDSKDQLIAEASELALDQVLDRMAKAAEAAPGPEGLREIVGIYLSEFHRDNAQHGCLFGALGAELAHTDSQTRSAATRGFEKMVELVAAQMMELSPEVAKQQATVTICTMIGALTMSRLVVGENLSNSILSVSAASILEPTF